MTARHTLGEQFELPGMPAKPDAKTLSERAWDREARDLNPRTGKAYTPAEALSATYKRPVITYESRDFPRMRPGPSGDMDVVNEGSEFSVYATSNIAYDPPPKGKKPPLTFSQAAAKRHDEWDSQVGEFSIAYPQHHSIGTRAEGHGAEILWTHVGEEDDTASAYSTGEGPETGGKNLYKRQGISTQMRRHADLTKPFDDPIEHSGEIWPAGEAWRDSNPEKRPFDPFKSDVIHMRHPGVQQELFSKDQFR